MSPGLLADLERYYDTAPRAACDTEELGPLTLFLPRSGFPYYARPRLGLAGELTAADVTAVLARQRELDVPRAVEWVHDTTPSLLAAAREAGMTVEECPLLVLEQDPPEPDPAAGVRIVAADDPFALNDLLRWIKLRREDLYDEVRRRAAIEELVALLAERSEEGT